MTNLHDIYLHMNSLAYKVGESQERVDRIRLAVAKDQFDSARHMPRTKGRGPRERTMAQWDEWWSKAERGEVVSGRRA